MDDLQEIIRELRRENKSIREEFRKLKEDIERDRNSREQSEKYISKTTKKLPEKTKKPLTKMLRSYEDPGFRVDTRSRVEPRFPCWIAALR